MRKSFVLKCEKGLSRYSGSKTNNLEMNGVMQSEIYGACKVLSFM